MAKKPGRERLRTCGKCGAKTVRSVERVSIFFGYVCRRCASLVPLLDGVARGLAGLLERHQAKNAVNRYSLRDGGG
jgi:hypothetical protein